MRTLTDAELVARYAGEADEAAFAEIARRHAPMVYGACRRLLGESGAADDAVQAVFMLLARKAASLSGREALAGWLHGAASLVAREHMRAARRRRRAEREAAEMRAAAERGGSRDWDAVRGELDAAIGKLPRHYREAILISCVEGRSEEETARELGVPAGTVKSRVSRGLEKLRERLAQRGNVLGVAALAGLLGEHAAPAMPAALAAKVAGLGSGAPAAGAATVTAGASASLLMMEGALRAMLMFKLKVAAAMLAAALIAGASVPVGRKLIAAAEGPGPALEARNEGIRCRVTKLLPGGSVVLSAGSRHGVKPGFEFDVTRERQRPGRGEQKLGAVKAKEVRRDETTAVMISFRQQIKVGDLATTRLKAVTPGTQPGKQQSQPASGTIAWGQAMNGLQAGLVPLGCVQRPGTDHTIVSGLAGHLKDGKSVVAALKEIAAKGGAVADVARLMERDIRAGRSLSEAMAARPKVFGPDCVGAVRDGEAARTVELSLAALARRLAAASAANWPRVSVCRQCYGHVNVKSHQLVEGKCAKCGARIDASLFKFCASCAAAERICMRCGKAKPWSATFIEGQPVRLEIHLRSTGEKPLKLNDTVRHRELWSFVFKPADGKAAITAYTVPSWVLGPPPQMQEIAIDRNKEECLELELHPSCLKNLNPGKYTLTAVIHDRREYKNAPEFWHGKVSTAPVQIEIKTESLPANATARHLGARDNWKKCALTLDDIHGLWGGSRISVDGSGKVTVTVVKDRKFKRYEFAVKVEEAEALFALSVKSNLVEANGIKRPGVPDESSPSLILRNADARDLSVRKWHSEKIPGFDPVFEKMRKLADRAKTLEPVKEGSWRP